ncbi:MAG TPA: vanadium-dependent haloperoxidase [Kofleriaceae bacterium]|nr:vanadium-dependent haloperoxidase [Kofleriaceae bacterium]
MKDVTRGSSKARTLVALLGLALLNACAAGNGDPSQASEAETASGSKPSNAVITRWSEVAYNAAVVATYFGPLLFHHDRGFTMMHIAQHDALNAIAPRYAQYAFTGRDSKADPIAACAQAAHDILSNVYPDQAATFDAELSTWLSTVPSGTAKTRGIALGAASAAAILNKRANDNIDNFGTYTPTPGPGNYQFVPPFDFVLQPALPTVPPFALASASQFRSGPPPSLTSSTYTAAFNEVKLTGVLNGSNRTQDQNEYAAFWWELTDAGWNRMARITATQEHLGLWRTARLFALINMAFIDGYIAGWDSKQFYDRWRPYTAIRAADTDGNPNTAPDTAWESYQTNPPVQDYPSTHSVLGKAASLVLAESFGTDHISFDLNSFTALPGKEIRHYDSFSFAATENADSRVRAGIHFRFATTEGLNMGSKVGSYVVTHALQPFGNCSLSD